MSTEPVRIGDTLDHRTSPAMTGGKVIEIHPTFARCETANGHRYGATLRESTGILLYPDEWHHGAHRPPVVEVGGTITAPNGTARTVRRIGFGSAFARQEGYTVDLCFDLDDRGALAEPDYTYTPPTDAPAQPSNIIAPGDVVAFKSTPDVPVVMVPNLYTALNLCRHQ